MSTCRVEKSEKSASSEGEQGYGSTFIFGDTRMPLERNIGYAEGSLSYRKPARSIQYYISL